MKLTSEFIEQLRSATDLADVIGQYAEFKGTGSRLMGRCPFPDHKDRSPSFSISRDLQLYNCFGCGKGGDVFTFLESYNGLTFLEAVEFLARRASIPFPDQPINPHGPKRGERDQLLRANRSAAEVYHSALDNLPRNHPAKAYLIDRGLNRETAVKFQLGYCEGNALQESEYTNRLGLSRDGREFFRGRITFPIHSPSGDVLAFGGRVIGGAVPKYLNSIDSPIFKKGSTLYALHETGKYIRAADQAVVVEGYMDAIALYSVGIQNVVAILGTAFTIEHARLLKRYTSNVIMLLDGDAAGLAGAERSFPVLLEANLLPKAYRLPKGEDPDDFVKTRGPESLKQELDRSPDLFSILLKEVWLKDYRGTVTDKVRVMDQVTAALAKAPNRNLTALYSMEVTRYLDVRQALVSEAIQRGQAPAARQPECEPMVRAKEPPAIVLKGSPRAEAMVLSLLLNFEPLLQDLMLEGFDELERSVQHPGIQSALRLLRFRYGEAQSAFAKLAAEFIAKVDDPYYISLAVTKSDIGIENLKTMFADYATSIQKKYLRERSQKLKAEIATDFSAEKLEELGKLLKKRYDLEK